MKRIATVLLTGFLCFSVYSQVDTSKSKFWMMTYFINGNDNVGARLAFTSDTTGAHWQKYNNEAAILPGGITVSGANDARMRDPMIAYDSINRKFNMVWTVSWTGTVIGWDTSRLLKSGTWGTQTGLGVGSSITNCAFSWAPEIFWDDIQSKWMIYWSVSISGSTTRIYYSIIPGTDFRAFGTPAVLFNPGYDIIDADIIKAGTGDYQMFFKDERTGYKYIRRVSGATTPHGTYGTPTAYVAAASTEGPTVFRAGGQYCVIVDHYSNAGLGIVRSTDINTTTSPWPGDASRMVYNGTGTTLMYVSHCNVIEVPKMLVKWMLYNDSAWVYYVRGTGVRDVNFVPLKNQNSNLNFYDAYFKMFNLSGRLMGVAQPAGADNVQSKSYVGHLPAGFYVKTAESKKGRSAAKELVQQK